MKCFASMVSRILLPQRRVDRSWSCQIWRCHNILAKEFPENKVNDDETFADIIDQLTTPYKTNKTSKASHLPKHRPNIRDQPNRRIHALELDYRYVLLHETSTPLEVPDSRNQFEKSVVQCMTRDATGQWACMLCDDKFEDVMMLVTHLLTSRNHNQTASTFSTLSAIKLCMLLDESMFIQMGQCYFRAVGENPLESVVQQRKPILQIQNNAHARKSVSIPGRYAQRLSRGSRVKKFIGKLKPTPRIRNATDFTFAMRITVLYPSC